MNKGKLIELVAKKTGQPKTVVADIINQSISAIVKTAKKEPVRLVGFGTFSVTKRKARKARNPRTGETIKIKAKKVLKFKPSKNVLG